MSRHVNISEVADQVLASVRAEANTKTASTQASPRVYVPAARELKKLAADLRAEDNADDVSDEDMAALLQDPEVAQLLEAIQNDPELLQMLMQEGGDMGGGLEADPNMPPAMPSDMPADMPPQMEGRPAQPGHSKSEGPAPKPASEKEESDNDSPAQKAASVIRKMAAQLKSSEDKARKVRLVKAAHVLNAATGLKHLTEGLT